ncbi:ABC transporter ATP-binding protein [Sporolituus thermophilus]|uniref:Carbohydrate ABC transporter ATP-binding protein, CUT1 family n=1 Tax=Sporolituus thermophilus DSM 23256 TaxID=1123285 RepID=A0A1G7HQ07_9FIRM|nr:sn-glycerol-3-phosphate ABC transporter ATP-binding protein UgpC [Sporolituus thermophilus]SDF02089.1 carbohydrate ABC transporter ATP-binding protein, CUT1 family [Sporolituus thermophilus DSM 23256]
MGRVVCEHVVKKFGEIYAVHDFNIDIADNEFIVIVGPSGCGKSTTLRMVAGLEQQTSGNIYIGGVLVNDKEPRDRNIAMVFQNYALYPHMNVYENMAFALKLRNVPKAEIDRRVKEAAEILSIGQYLHRKPRELSGGQRQRVALGRAIVREPAVFLMDEPLSNLDAKLRVQMRTEIAKLHNRLKTTTIYVTHDQVEAMTMADRIVVMRDGVIQQIADPQTIYDSPANKFVAGFIGTPPMNFLTCRLERADGLKLIAQGLQVALPAAMADKLAGVVGREVTLGVRPEHMRPATGSGHAQATVEVVEPMGSENYLNVRVGSQGMVVRVKPDFKPVPGEAVAFEFDLGKIHLFDHDSGITII